ncbi:DENN domain-containing protein 1B isoform X3 [Ctenocephalides felis]|uniref:DENN domain-containing protein 1B isoform X3 n=1 Tax=Ctenocephalides felis TaxID=7515 RepID=UPI000E6E472E|nr:DENN domain-containing protein 1B isoform X3 [Ctenocephalides felis]
MHSRRREDVRRLFECWCEVEPGAADRPAWVKRKFPETYKDDDLQSVPKFAFPCEMEITVVQHFSFVLTRMDGKWTYGFCRHDPQQTTAFVVLTYLPWPDIFFKFLNCIAQASRTPNLKDFLTSAYYHPVPDPDQNFELKYEKGDGVNPFAFQVPNPRELPKIPENRNLTEYYSAMDSDCMLHVLAAMLTERRIIFSSKNLGRLSCCVQAANTLIYPMVWQQLFIPVLPIQLIDYLQAPMPFLIGVPDPVLKTVRTSDLGEVVIINIDDNTVKTPFDDLAQMPQEVVDQLKKSLKNRPSLLGDGVARAFLRAIVQLTKGYRDAMEFREKIVFNGDLFVESRPQSYRPFIRSMLRLQTFQQFIEDRLHMLNSGTSSSDEFENELAVSSEHANNRFKQQYKEWTRQMRKEGSAFIRTVKDKTNPAVKSAVKSVRDGGKGVRSAYKGLRSRFRENVTTTDGGLTVYSAPRNGLRSAPDSPSSSRRPKSYAIPSRTYRKENSAYNLSNSYVDSSPTVSPQSPLQSHIVGPEIDLMKELQNHHLFQNLPIVDRTLKPPHATSRPQLEAHTLPRDGPYYPDLQLSQEVPIGTLCYFDTPPSSNRSSFDSVQFHSTRDSSSYSSCNPADLSFGDEKDFMKTPPKTAPDSNQNPFETNKVTALVPAFGISNMFNSVGSNHFPITSNQFSSSTPNKANICNNPKSIENIPPPPIVPPRPSAKVGKGGIDVLENSQRLRTYKNVKKPPDVGGDLIRLDSTPDLQDFDPLSSNSSNNNLTQIQNSNSETTGIKFSQSASNIPNGFGGSPNKQIDSSKNDLALLQEYGLDFSKFSICNKNVVSTNLQSNGTNKHWTTFD